MKNPVKVHMLPTEDKTDIVRNTYCFTEAHGNPLRFVTDLNNQDNLIEREYEFQHLYFSSDEEPNDGDWCIIYNAIGTEMLVQYNDGKYHHKLSNGGYNTKEEVKGRCRKIVATTDKSLKVGYTIDHDPDKLSTHTNLEVGTKSLPQIPQSFIEEYVKAGGIDDVLLECELDYSRRQGIGIPLYQRIAIDSLYKLKTDQNNCVIVHPIEPKLYTKEEVEEVSSLYESIIHGDFHVMTEEDMYKRIKQIIQ
jgi:hypothetical protein